MNPNDQFFDMYTPLQQWILVECGGGQIVPAVGFSSLGLRNGMKGLNVLHPTLAVSLLSISASFLAEISVSSPRKLFIFII